MISATAAHRRGRFLSGEQHARENAVLLAVSIAASALTAPAGAGNAAPTGGPAGALVSGQMSVVTLLNISRSTGGRSASPQRIVRLAKCTDPERPVTQAFDEAESPVVIWRDTARGVCCGRTLQDRSGGCPSALRAWTFPCSADTVRVTGLRGINRLCPIWQLVPGGDTWPRSARPWNLIDSTAALSGRPQWPVERRRRPWPGVAMARPPGLLPDRSPHGRPAGH